MHFGKSETKYLNTENSICSLNPKPIRKQNAALIAIEKTNKILDNNDVMGYSG